MRRVITGVASVLVSLLMLGANQTFPVAGARAMSAIRPLLAPLNQTPTCWSICDKSGVNFAYPERQPMDDYLRAQRLGMGWELEIAYYPQDLLRTAEAMNRALDHGLRPVLRICAGGTCAFSDPNVYAQFLIDLAPMVNGEFWALLGPNEPEQEGWAGDAAGVASYMNSVLAQVDSIPNLRTVSPAFNATNGITHQFFTTMEIAGARFADLDAFAANTYTISGNGAYYYYAYNTGHAETLRAKAIRYGKRMIFTEYGTFGMFDKPDLNDPRRATIVQEIRAEFGKASSDSTVLAILHFDAFGTNGSLHRYSDAEMIEIARNQTCTGGGARQAGVGISTQNTVWQLSGEYTCRIIPIGCPFLQGVPCGGAYCIDNDADGLYGDGGACRRDDCDDSDPTIGSTCGGEIAETPGAWGTLRVVDTDAADHDTDVWPVLAIRPDGMPIIGYYHNTVGARDLNMLECRSVGCATALRRVLVSEDFSGMYPSLAIGTNGFPFFVHFDRVDDDLEVFACLDGSCRSGERHIIDYTTGFYGMETSVAVRPDGRPAIAYWNSNLEDLNFFDCVDASCSGGSIRILDDRATTGRNPSITMGADGQPLIVYEHPAAAMLQLIDCSDESCTGWTAPILDSGAGAFNQHAIAIRPDGAPVIVYRNQTTGALQMIDCQTPECATSSIRVLDDAGNFFEASMTLLYDGSPFIAYREQTASSSNLKLLRCLDPSCASLVTEIARVGGVGRHPDVARRISGDPLVVFFDVSQGDLVVYDVDLDMLPGGHGPTPTPSHTPVPLPTATLTGTQTLLPIGSLSIRLDGPQPELTIKTVRPDSCSSVRIRSQTRIDNAITVEVIAVHPASMICSQVVTPITLKVVLQGDFPPGDYTVTVNGNTLPFTVP